MAKSSDYWIIPLIDFVKITTHISSGMPICYIMTILSVF